MEAPSAKVCAFHGVTHQLASESKGQRRQDWLLSASPDVVVAMSKAMVQVINGRWKGVVAQNLADGVDNEQAIYRIMF